MLLHRTNAARPLLARRPPRLANARTVVYKRDSPDGTTSQLQWAALGGSILAVAGGYGYMMGKPQQVVRTDQSPVAITEKATEDVKRRNA
ncbi:hypothetical protein VTH06DRAFT_3128 [Thermothelomyces fergusii]